MRRLRVFSQAFAAPASALLRAPPPALRPSSAFAIKPLSFAIKPSAVAIKPSAVAIKPSVRGMATEAAALRRAHTFPADTPVQRLNCSVRHKERDIGEGQEGEDKGIGMRCDEHRDGVRGREA